MKWLICSECSCVFEDQKPPADTHESDDPMCDDCIEKMLNSIEAEPLSEERIQAMVDYAVGRTNRLDRTSARRKWSMGNRGKF